MKKILFVLTLVFFATTSFAQNGVIKELVGTVEIKAAGSANFVAATAGAQVAQDTVISTGFRSSAIIEVGSSIITVRPLTRLSLTEIQTTAATENINVNLQAGRVRVDVNPPAGARANLSVTGPTATASVRGTSFEVDTRNVFVGHGIVSFRGNNSRTQEFVVFGGDTSSVTPGGTVQDPITTAINAISPPRPDAGVPSGIDTSNTRPRTPVANPGVGVDWQ